jgi:hypothetical protein
LVLTYILKGLAPKVPVPERKQTSWATHQENKALTVLALAVLHICKSLERKKISPSISQVVLPEQDKRMRPPEQGRSLAN